MDKVPVGEFVEAWTHTAIADGHPPHTVKQGIKTVESIARTMADNDGNVDPMAVNARIQQLQHAAESTFAHHPPAQEMPTFGDWLALIGYPMHPETVIMDATAINRELYRRENDGEPPVTRATIQDALALPPYDYLLMEWRDTSAENTSLPLPFYRGLVAYWQAAMLQRVDADRYNLHALSLTQGTPTDPGTLMHSHAPIRVHFENGCYVSHNLTASDPDELHPTALTNKHGEDYAVFAVWALSFLHQRADVELVTQTRGPRRRFEKKHGKQPSPYFRFRDIHPGASRKAYTDSSPTGRTMPVHSVRGHFRHYQDGKIVWVRPHVRGSGDSVQSRPYRIILPKESN